MKWISVKQKMPNEGEEILVTDTLNFHIATYRSEFFLFKCCDDDNCSGIDEVLYWTPLIFNFQNTNDCQCKHHILSEDAHGRMKTKITKCDFCIKNEKPSEDNI